MCLHLLRWRLSAVLLLLRSQLLDQLPLPDDCIRQLRMLCPQPLRPGVLQPARQLRIYLP